MDTTKLAANDGAAWPRAEALLPSQLLVGHRQEQPPLPLPQEIKPPVSAVLTAHAGFGGLISQLQELQRTTGASVDMSQLHPDPGGRSRSGEAGMVTQQAEAASPAAAPPPLQTKPEARPLPPPRSTSTPVYRRAGSATYRVDTVAGERWDTKAAVPSKRSYASTLPSTAAPIDGGDYRQRYRYLLGRLPTRPTQQSIMAAYLRNELREIVKVNCLSYHKPGSENQMKTKTDMAEDVLVLMSLGQLRSAEDVENEYMEQTSAMLAGSGGRVQNLPQPQPRTDYLQAPQQQVGYETNEQPNLVQYYQQHLRQLAGEEQLRQLVQQHEQKEHDERQLLLTQHQARLAATIAMQRRQHLAQQDGLPVQQLQPPSAGGLHMLQHSGSDEFSHGQLVGRPVLTPVEDSSGEPARKLARSAAPSPQTLTLAPQLGEPAAHQWRRNIQSVQQGTRMLQLPSGGALDPRAVEGLSPLDAQAQQLALLADHAASTPQLLAPPRLLASPQEAAGANVNGLI